MRFVLYSTDANDSENEESVGTPSLAPEDETFFGMCAIFISYLILSISKSINKKKVFLSDLDFEHLIRSQYFRSATCQLFLR